MLYVASMATNAKSGGSKKSSKKSSKKRSSKSHKAITTADNQPSISGALAGHPGPGPKVGDSAYKTPREDLHSTGREYPTGDGTNAGAGAPQKLGKKDGNKATSSASGGPEIGDIVIYVTDGRVPGKLRPAIVQRQIDTEAENADEMRIDVTVFPDAGKYPNNDHLGNVHFAEGVRYSENLEPRTWHKKGDSVSLLDKKEKSEATQIEQEQEKIDAPRRKK
jgi:hypothetical protein